MSFLNRYNRTEDNVSNNAIKIGSVIYRIGNLISNNGQCNFISKIDQNGIVVWEKSYYYEGYKVSLFNIVECPNGDFIIFGIGEGQTDNLYLFRVNGNGGVVWQKRLNTTAYNLFGGQKSYKNLISLSNENYVVAFSESVDNQVTAVVVVKFGASGNIIKQKRIKSDKTAFIPKGMVKGPNKISLYGSEYDYNGNSGTGMIIDLNFNLDTILHKILADAANTVQDVIFKNQEFIARGTDGMYSFFTRCSFDPSDQIVIQQSKLFSGDFIYNVQYNDDFIYTEHYDRANGIFCKINYNLDLLWTKRYDFVDIHYANGILCDVTYNTIVLVDGPEQDTNFGDATIGSLDLDLTSCRTVPLDNASLVEKRCNYKVSQSDFYLQDTTYILDSIPAPVIENLISEKQEICDTVIEDPCVKDADICKLYDQLLNIQMECLRVPVKDITDYKQFIKCFEEALSLIYQFDKDHPQYGLVKFFAVQIKVIKTFISNASSTNYVQAWDALDFIITYLSQLGNCNCENIFTDTNYSAIQSGHLYLQAAGSTGEESTKGIHLRWMFRDKLTSHLPKANYATNSNGFNKPDDFVKIYRAPYTENKIIVDFNTAPSLVNDTNAFAQKHWIYNVGPYIFYIYFRNTTKYNQVRATINPATDPFVFIKNYGDALIEVENKVELSFAVSAKFTNNGAPGTVKVELLSVEVNKITATKTASLRKEYETDDLNQQKLFSENIRSIRMLATDAILTTLEFELYSDFIQRTTRDFRWSFINKLALTKNTYTAYNRLEPSADCLDQWLHFNDSAFVNPDNYRNRWTGDPSEPIRNMKYVVDKYITLSDDVSNPLAVEGVLTNPPADVESCMASNGNYVPNTNTSVDVSFLSLLQVASLDYHNARMLGLGVLDLQEQVFDGSYIYMAEYVSFANLNDGMSDGKVQHLYCSLPTSLTDQRLPDAVEIAAISPGISTSDEGSNFELIDEEGYTSDHKARYLSLFNVPLHKEISGSAFYYTNYEFISSIKTNPIFVGLEYKKSSNANWISPELSHDFVYFDTNGIAETKGILLPPVNRPFYIHREREAGLHRYASYGINWFSRSRRSQEFAEIETVLRPANELLPPTNVNALLIKKEKPLALTSLSEQIMFNAIPQDQDKTIIRLSFDYNHGQELIDYHYKINGNVVKDYYELPDNLELFADDIQVFFRNRVPGIVTGKIKQVIAGANPVSIQVTTEVYPVISSGVNTNVPATVPPTYNEMYTPEIASGQEGNFIGSIMLVDNVEFIVQDVDNSGTYPKFTLFKADPNGGEVNLNTIINPANVLLIPHVNSMFTVVENMQEIAAWETPNPYPFTTPLNGVKIDQIAVHREEIIVTNPDCNSDTHLQKFRGIYENAVIEKVKEKIDEDNDGEYDPDPTDPSGFKMRHQGIYKITFTGFTLLQHSQFNKTDFSVEFSNGIVRLHTLAEPQGRRKELKVIKAENIGVTGSSLVLYVCDLSFPTNLSQVPAYAGKIMGVNDNQVTQKVNYYPSYKIYFTKKASFGFTEANLLPLDEEDFKYSVFGLRSHDNPNEVVEAGVTLDNIADYYSRFSQPAFMFAQANIAPAQPDKPLGGNYATRPDFFGKASYTFTTQFTHKPYSVQFNRASDIQILAALYDNEKIYDGPVQTNYPNTVQDITDNLFQNGEEPFYINLWESLLDFDPAHTNTAYQTFTDADHSVQMPLPDSPFFIAAINSFIDAHNAFYHNLPTHINHLNLATLNLETEVIPLVNNADGTVRNDQLKFRHFIKDVVFNCFVPLTEIPVIYKLVKGQADYFPNYKPIPKKQVVRDRNGNLLAQNDPAFDMAPMMRIIGTNKTQFTDFGLDGASNAKYFYTVREFNSQLQTGEYSSVIGPIGLVNSAPPIAPEIIKIIPVPEDRTLGNNASIQLQINAYNKTQNIKRINIYRATNANDSLSIRTMPLIRVIDFDLDENLQDNPQWIFTDDFSDLPQVPFADPLYYRITVSRKIQYNDKDGLLVVDYAPSEASKLVWTNVVENYSPESPVLNYTADLYDPATSTALDYITLSWEETAYKGNYHLYKMNAQGVWIEIIRVMADRTTKGVYHFYNLDVNGNWVNTLHPAPLVTFGTTIYLPLELTDLATSSLPTKTADGKPISHYLKVIAENTSGMFSKEENILTMYNADTYHFDGGIAPDTGETGMIIQGNFIVRHN